MSKIALIEKKFLKKEVPSFSVGDTVNVFVRVAEGDKSRLQAFEGTVIARKGSGVRETLTLRRISYGEGVERVFPLHSPHLEKIEVVKRGKTRRAKLYYLRKTVGKKSKLEERETGNVSEPATEEVRVENPSP